MSIRPSSSIGGGAAAPGLLNRARPTARSRDLPQLLAVLRKYSAWGIGAVLLTGFVIRIWGIDFGLPYRYHIDEQGWVAYGGLLCAGQVDFPSWTAGPNLLHVVMCGGDALIYGAGLMAGAWETPLEFKVFYDTDPTLIYLAGRLISALFGVVTLFVAYLLGRRLWNRRIGLIAMIMLTFTFLHARDSHFVVSDILVTLLLTLSLYSCAIAMKGRPRRPLIVAGALAGMAAGVKLSLVFSIMPVALTYWLYSGEVDRATSRVRGAAEIALATLVGYVVGYPNVLKAVSDFSTLMQDFLSEFRASEIRAALWQIDSLPGWLFYLQSLGHGLGLLLAGLAFIGVAYSLWRRTPEDYLLLSFAIPFFVFVGSRSYFTAHYMMPLIPILALLASRVLVVGISQLPLARPQKFYLTAFILLVVLLPSVLSIARNNYLLTQEDTRTAAKRWIESNIPANATIATSIYYAWEPQLSSDGNPQPDSTRSYRVITLGGLGGVSDVPFYELKAQGIEFVLVSNFVYDIPLRDETRQQTRDDFFDSLTAESTLIHVESPYRDGFEPEFAYDQVYGPWTSLDSVSRPGPSIQIFALQ